MLFDASIVTSRQTVPYATNKPLALSRYGASLMDVSVSAVTNTVSYDSLGRQIAYTDGRGNTRHTEYNVLGQRSVSIDALGNRTTYAYDQFGNLASVTDPLGNATVYEYDLRGRKTYEGGATYPVRYEYDTFGNKTTMTTYRNESLGPNSGDVTTWLYDVASGGMTNKVYADGKGPTYSYTPNGKLSRRTWARGIMTDYVYDGWGNLTNTVYSDDTPAISLVYNAFGRQTEAHDATGITTFLYDAFGSITNETVIGVAGTNTIIRHWDNFGRSLGYSLVGRVVPNEPQRQSTLAYNPTTARLSSMLAAGSETPFAWNYINGSDLKSSLAYPNGLIVSWTYDANNQLLQVCNATPTNTISQYDYTYDDAGRRVACGKSGTAFAQNDTIAYAYNNRSELTNAVAVVDSDYRYAYDFDDIGNRETSYEHGTNSVYTANQLNQYTEISDSALSASPRETFTPQFDDDGNQTLIKTATGIWSVTYNGENRPILWTLVNSSTPNSSTPNSSTPPLISMSFDRMGRRVTKNAQRFVYNGYLQIANFDLQTSNIKLQTFIWDPTEPIVTRPFVWLRGDSVAYYTHDGSKNVSEAVARNGDVVAYYEYAPFGAITLMRDESTGENPWRFSCEYSDDVLGLLHFNYRHYSVNDGRWLSYDRNEDVALMGYLFCKNSPLEIFDYLGLLPVSGASSVHGRGGEGQFDSIASKASDNWTSVKTGNDILEDMKRLSKSGNCIEKYTIAGHGWAHKDGEGRALGPGIPGGGEDTGFYTEKRKGAGSVGIPELKKAVGDGSICFCKKCKIQIYSCRIDPAFSLMLAKATGCSVVSASSSCSRLESGKWQSAPGSYDEKLQGGYFGFTESTPSGTKEKGMDYEPF